MAKNCVKCGRDMTDKNEIYCNRCKADIIRARENKVYLKKLASKK